MKRFISLLIFITFIGCNNIENKLNNSLKVYLETYAFKNNASIDILELKLISVEKTTLKSVDSLKLLKLSGEYKILKDKFENQNEKTKNNINIYKIEKSLGWSTLENIQKSDIEKDLIELAKIEKEMKNNFNQDSIIRKHIFQLSDNRDTYKAKFYLKAVLKSNNKSLPNINFSDSTYHFFDKEFKKIEI